jgi:hypothetical protein
MQIANMQKVSVVYQTAQAAIAMTDVSVLSFAISMPN